MTATRLSTPNPTPSAPFPDARALWWADPLFAVQRTQWEAFLSWQQSLATFYGDLWEQWAMRYGGGMPIDG